MDEKEYEVDLEAVKRRRKRKLMWKRIRNVSILVCLIVLIGAFLFSPWGPWGEVFFATDETQESMEPQQTTVDGAELAAETGEAAEGDAAPGEVSFPQDKTSDPNAPSVAIVVDDVGLEAANLEQWLSIDAPITFAVLPYCVASPELADRLYGAGFRIMMHIPTENEPPRSYSGNGQLATGMSRQTVFLTLDGDMATVPHVTGINNHQGGKGCNDLQLMTYECEWAQERGLFVVDSNSSAQSQVSAAATSLGFPRRESQVFIDHQNEPEYIRSEMRRLARIAQQDGTATGICHFQRPNTPSVVGEMIRTLRAEGIHFAFVQDIHN